MIKQSAEDCQFILVFGMSAVGRFQGMECTFPMVGLCTSTYNGKLVVAYIFQLEMHDKARQGQNYKQ
jgi:hypothetical protein